MCSTSSASYRSLLVVVAMSSLLKTASIRPLVELEQCCRLHPLLLPHNSYFLFPCVFFKFAAKPIPKGVKVTTNQPVAIKFVLTPLCPHFIPAYAALCRNPASPMLLNCETSSVRTGHWLAHVGLSLLDTST